MSEDPKSIEQQSGAPTILLTDIRRFATAAPKAVARAGAGARVEAVRPQWALDLGPRRSMLAGVVKSPLEFVQPVQRRHLVSFSQRRIVEHGIAEIFDGSAICHHGLPDVHDLRRALAENMHSQQFPRVPVE
jgi:hypothetical protein